MQNHNWKNQLIKLHNLNVVTTETKGISLFWGKGSLARHTQNQQVKRKLALKKAKKSRQRNRHI